MNTFQQYYEAYSIDPRQWDWVKKIINRQDNIARQNARKHAIPAFKKLKEVLKERGYNIEKSNTGSYTVRASRTLGLDPKGIRDNPRLTPTKLTKIPFISALFTMAHEVGHVLQWRDDDEKHKFMEFYQQILQSRKEGVMDTSYLEHLHRVWYELNAWVEGMQFIPVEYRPEYKKYAYQCYKTYMSAQAPKQYNNEMFLRNLLHQLNFEDHDK